MTSVLVFVLLALQGPAQTLPRPPKAPEPPTAYEQLVARYQQGDYDSVVTEVARQPARTFEQPYTQAFAKAAYHAQDEKLRQVLRGGFKNADWKIVPKDWFQAQDSVARFLFAVMMLHTEAALRVPVGEMQAQLHLARTAEKALADTEREMNPHEWNKVKFQMPQDPQSGYLTVADVERARHDWLVLVVFGYHARSVLDGLNAFITASLQRYPNDPPLELALGVSHEGAARIALVDESLAREIYSNAQVAAWQRILQQALAVYEQAAKSADFATEAQLRIGRIQAQLGDTTRAREALEPLTGPTDPLFVRYLASMILGDVEKAAKRPDAAADHYRAALVLFPTSQAPLVALSRLADERGDQAGARDWLEKSFALSTGRRVDPWWFYYVPFVNLPAQVQSLREQLRQ